MASRQAVDKGYLGYRFQTAVSIRMPSMSIPIFKDRDRQHTLTNIIPREKKSGTSTTTWSMVYLQTITGSG